MIDWSIFLAALVFIFATAIFASPTLIWRLASLVAVMLGTTIIVSGSLRIVPGDPIDHILGDQAQNASRELLARDLGLMDEHGQPLSFVAQYSHFLRSFVSFKTRSFITRNNTMDMVLERLPFTIALSFGAMIVAMMVGPFLGVLASFFSNRWPDHLLSLFALVGISVPSFFLGPLLLLLFAIRLKFLPISGADDGLYSLVLPSFSMGLALAAMLMRMSRASMLEILSEDFIRTARSKGLAPRVVFFKHALRNALIPITTLIGLQFGAVLAGAVVTEKIFNWPGIGLLLLESIQRLDMPVVQTCVLLIAFIYAFVNLLTDIAYGLIDPRITFGSPL